MHDTITLHTLGPDDMNILLDVRDGLFDNAIRPEQAHAFLRDSLHVIILALDRMDAVGMASGQVMLHPDKPPVFFVAEVGVRGSHQRRGIAKRLCAELLEWARNKGCIGIWLATEGDNTAARALYRSLDARETKNIVVYDWDGAMDMPD